MSEVEQQKAACVGPREGSIAVVSVSTASGAIDLSLAAELGTLASAGSFIRLVCDQALYYRFAAATGTADETATTGNNRVHLLPANTEARVRLPRTDTGAACVWFIHKAAGTGKARISAQKDNF